MNELKYYLDMDNKILTAYDQESDFFVQYIEEKNDWDFCKISIMEFKHRCNYEAISEKVAFNLARGNLPEKQFEDYIQIINSNRNCLDK